MKEDKLQLTTKILIQEAKQSQDPDYQLAMAVRALQVQFEASVFKRELDGSIRTLFPKNYDPWEDQG